MAAGKLSRRGFLTPWRLRAVEVGSDEVAAELAAAAEPSSASVPSAAMRTALHPLPPRASRRPPSGDPGPAFVAGPGAPRLVTVQLDTARCTAYRGLPCRICYDLCPVPGVLRMARGERGYLPVAGPQPCVGCGICAHHCPAEGALRMVALADGDPAQVRISTSTADLPAAPAPAPA